MPFTGALPLGNLPVNLSSSSAWTHSGVKDTLGKSGFKSRVTSSSLFFFFLPLNDLPRRSSNVIPSSAAPSRVA